MPQPSVAPQLTPAPSLSPEQIGHQKVVASWGETAWSSFHELVQRESGWRVGVKNPHGGACGLGQALPCAKMGTLYGSAEGELTWTIDYIKQRYGTPQNAMAHERKFNWY